MDSNSTRIIFWSGGFDSTLLLLDTINQVNNGNEEVTIQCVTVVSDRIVNTKNEREKSARNKIKQYIANKYPDVIVQYREIVVNTFDDGSFNEGSVQFGQSLLWALNVIPFVEEKSTLLFGYILDDHLSTCKFYGPFNNLLHAANELCLKELTFDFPFITCSKEDIITELIKSYPDVIDYLTCCEGLPYKDNCGKCKPCLTLIKSLINLSVVNTDNINEAKDMLEKRFGLSVTVNKLDNCKFNKEHRESGIVLDGGDFAAGY